MEEDRHGGFGRRYGKFRVRDIRGRNVMVDEVHDVYVLRHVTGPFPVSPVPALAGEVVDRYRI
jgi:hypothetical protein